MRIALISDIHGNFAALKAVLDDLQTRSTDRIVCLGDLATDGPQPREVIAQLQTLQCPSITGNMDAWALDPRPSGGTSENARRGAKVGEWVVDQLAPGDREYLGASQTTLSVPLADNANLLCYHGSPRSNEEGITSTTPDEDLEQILSGHSATVMAGGHTHTQMIRRFGHTTLFNPGTIGAPSPRNRDPRFAWAEYGIIGWKNDNLSIELHRVAINTDQVRQAALDSGMPHAEWWFTQRYGTTD